MLISIRPLVVGWLLLQVPFALAAPATHSVSEYPAAHASPGEIPVALAVDSRGYSYLAGTAPSPIAGRTAKSVYVAKVDPSGENRIYTAYIGGSGLQQVTAVAVDALGNVYVTGYTSSRDFPVIGAVQAAPGGGLDAFVAKLDAKGATWLYSTYLGGTGDDMANGIAVDLQGNAYVAGRTTSSNFPLENAAQSERAGESDGFLAEIGADGGTLLYATYLGGALRTSGNAIAMDSTGAIFIAGSAGGRMRNGSPGGVIAPPPPDTEQAFLLNMAADGSKPEYIQAIGTTRQQQATSIGVDPQGAIYVTGWTNSPDFPVTVGGAEVGGRAVFAVKFAADGTRLYSTLIGGAEGEIPPSIAADALGSAYVGAGSRGTGAHAGLLVKLSPGGDRQLASETVAGVVASRGLALAVAGSGRAIMAGTSGTGQPYAARVSTCGFRLPDGMQTVGAEGGAGSLSVETSPECEWQAESGVSWLELGGTGAGSGTLRYRVAANRGASRGASIAIGGETVIVTQAGGGASRSAEGGIAGAIRANPGFRAVILTGCDDCSSAQSAGLGFSIDFYGRTYTQAWVNANGNITFDGTNGSYTSVALAALRSATIAPFWADVDTRNAARGVISYGRDVVDGHAAFGVNWTNVGYYAGHQDKLNSFQLVLIDRSDVGAGFFDIEMNYSSLQWEAGDASGRASARVGFTNGTGLAGTYLELPGSGESGALLDDGARSLTGRHTFSVRPAGSAGPSNSVRPADVVAEPPAGPGGGQLQPLTTVAAGTITEYTLSSAVSNNAPSGIAAGPDGALWFTEQGSGKIGRITTAGSITEFTIPTANSMPAGIVKGPDNLLWFTESGKIGKVTTSGSFTEYPFPDGLDSNSITVGPDGALWFAEYSGNRIGRITTSGSITEFPTSDIPDAIATGADGALWFTEYSGKIGRITTAGSITEYTIPTANSAPEGIAAGPDGALWFAESIGNKIGRITTAGSFTEYLPITVSSEPYPITAGPDGALWFGEVSGNNIGRITTSGTITEYPIPTAGVASPLALAVGSDGAIWFTETNANKIGRIVPGPVLSIAKGHSGSFTQGQQGATYTVTVSNAEGAGTTSGTVTITESVPPGLALVSMAGTGWTCLSGGATCTRGDVLSGGASYPAITVAVSVGSNAISPQVNNVSVSGGGSVPASATDSTVVAIAPVSIVCTPSPLSFTFTIGGTQPTSESCSITSSPSGMNVSASANTASGGNWLSVSQNSGVTPESLTVSVNTLGLAANSYNGNVTAIVGGQSYNLPVTLTVTPPTQTTFTLTPTSGSVPATASTGTTALSLVPSNSTGWTTASTASWLHITSPASGSGAATIGYSVDANTGAARSGSFNVSSGGEVVATFTVNQASSCLSLSVAPTSLTFGSTGGIGLLTFNIAGCSWTASASDTTLVTGLPTSGNTGSITFGVAAGTTAASATITIPSTVPLATVTVTRTAPVCTYTIATPGAIGTSQSFLAAGGTGSVNVTAPAGCAWTASSSSPFLAVTGGASGSGSGSMSYSVSSNPSSSASRTGTLTVAGIAYTVNQIPQGSQTYSCTSSAGAPPSVRGGGIAELAGDLVVTCSGVSAGGVTGDVLVTLNTSLTNHTLNADPSGQTTDALLLVDEPSSANLTPGGGSQNVYSSSIAGPLAVRFPNVSLAPETGTFHHVFRITNVRVDASHVAVPGPVMATVSIVSAAPFSLGSSASQTVAFVQQSSSSRFTVGSSAAAPLGQSLAVTFAETAATAYRVKLASGQDPSAVGTVYASESGYVNTAVLGNEVGFATNGTRLVARFANIPTGTLVYAPVAQASGSASAVLVSADINGAGGSAMQGSAQVPGYQPVALFNGAGTATWEITSSNPVALDSVTFNLILSNSTLVLQSSCAAGSAPSICGAIGPQVAVSAPSNTAPVPRFVNPTVAAPSQVTKLNIAPNPAGGQSGSTTSKKPRVDSAARRVNAAVPQTSGGSGNVVSVGGTVTIGEILQSDVNSPPVNGACVGTTLPPSYTITACSADNGGTCTPTGANSISTCYPSFDPGQSSNINVTADTTDTGDSTAELDSNATSDLGNFGAGSFTQIVAVAPGPSIKLSFQGPSGIPAGKTITYTVSLNNTGAAKLAGDPMIVTLAPDASLTGILAPLPGVGDAAWTCTPGGATIVCTNTSGVAAGGQSSFEVTANVPLGEAGGMISTAATLTLGGQVSAKQPVNTSVGPGVPRAVTLLSPANGATGVSTSPSLTWSAATGATSYTVNFGASNPPPLVFNTPGLTYSPATLTSGTTYYWQITATNSSGSTPSAVWSFTAGPPAGFRFVPVTPCRVMDTRGATGTFGGPAIAGGSTRNVPIPQSACGIPATAQAYSLNSTVVPPASLTYLTIWPAGQSQPVVSTLNSLDGRIVANAAIVPAGASGAISVFVSNTTDVIIDINGYFAPAATAGSMSFYSAMPCRVVDTRNANGAFSGPFMSGGSTRNFEIPSSPCGVPATAQAYSLNMTVVPHGPLQYLTTWPTGQTQPLVSTLNALDGSIVANAAIVPAGTGGAVSVFVTNDTDVIIDINGYFAPPGSTGALSLYTLTPCRVADTRGATGAFGGPSLAANGARSFAIPSSTCSVPSTAQAYSLNVTAVPPGSLTYLTAWPTGQTQPVVSTLNSLAGKVVANAAIVPAGTGGAVSIFVSNATDAILDINAYFAQ